MVDTSGSEGIGGDQAGGADGNEGVPAVSGQESGDQAGTPNSSNLIDPSKLPEEMRGKTPDEIGSMWSAAARVLEARNAESDSQNARIAMLESAMIEKEKLPEVDPLEGRDLKELMYESPEEAVDLLMRKNYGSTIDRLNAGIEQTAMIAAKADIGPDFDEHEDAVKAILAKSGGQIDAGAINGAYLMAVGLAEVQNRKAAKKISIETPAPTPEVLEGDMPGKLTGLAKQIQLGSRMTEEDFVKYGSGELDVEVPGL